MNNKKIIGLCGRMRSGKTMLCKELLKVHDGKLVTIAAPLKLLVGDILGLDYDEVNVQKDKNHNLYDFTMCHNDVYTVINKWTGINIIDIKKVCEEYESKNKELIWTVRKMLQFIGTNIIREFKPTWHVEQMIKNINSINSGYVLIDDVRFMNERKAIENLGGECFFCVRPTSIDVQNHECENSISWKNFDSKHILINDAAKDETIKRWIKYVDNNFSGAHENFITLEANKIYETVNINFGTIKTPLVNKILQQNKNEDYFINSGIILYEAKNFSEIIEYCHEVLSKFNSGVMSCHKFVLYNPIVYENLKKWL